MMSVAFDDSIGVLAQSWGDYHNNRDNNYWKIRLDDMSDWKVIKYLRKCWMVSYIKSCCLTTTYFNTDCLLTVAQILTNL